MKSNIKKDDVLRYLLDKFNDTTQEVGFVMGSEGLPLYRMMTDESARGNGEYYEFVDEETYQLSKTQAIPVAIPVITADYASLATVDQSSIDYQRITSSSWSAVVSFLVFQNSYVHRKLTFAMEEFRDKFLGNLDILQTREYDYLNTSQKPNKKFLVVATSAGDLIPSGLVTINGDIFLEYTLQIDLDTSDDIAYGNQFEFYITNDKPKKFVETTLTVYNSAVNKYQSPTLPTDSSSFDEGDVFRIGSSSPYTYFIVVDTYKRILPIQASWGASNSLSGFQLLNNLGLSQEDIIKSKMVHNIVASRGWGINFTFFFQPSKPMIKELFKETYRLKDKMNTPYVIKMKFKRLDVIEGVPQFVYDDEIGFEYNVATGEGGTEVVYGDITLFTIGFSPSWINV